MSPKILIVDDLPSARKVISAILRRIGIDEITEAQDGAAALALVNANEFDVIISDWRMPKLNGLDFLRAVRERDGEARKTAFIIVTSSNQKDEVIEAFEAGVDDYICKPFTAAVLEQKINSSLIPK